MIDLILARVRHRDREREIESDLRNRELVRQLKRRGVDRLEAMDDHEGRALISAILATRPR